VSRFIIWDIVIHVRNCRFISCKNMNDILTRKNVSLSVVEYLSINQVSYWMIHILYINFRGSYKNYLSLVRHVSVNAYIITQLNYLFWGINLISCNWGSSLLKLKSPEETLTRINHSTLRATHYKLNIEREYKFNEALDSVRIES
jgi:hypothetical protein